MITKGGIVVIVEALVIEMALKIAVLALKCKEALYRLNVSKVLICRGNIRKTIGRKRNAKPILNQLHRGNIPR